MYCFVNKEDEDEDVLSAAEVFTLLYYVLYCTKLVIGMLENRFNF